MRPKYVLILCLVLLPILSVFAALAGFAIYQCSPWTVLEKNFPMPDGSSCSIRLIENPRLSSALIGARSEHCTYRWECFYPSDSRLLDSVIHVSDSGCGGWKVEQITADRFVAFMYFSPFFTLHLKEGKWRNFEPRDFVGKNRLRPYGLKGNLLDAKGQVLLSGDFMFLDWEETRGIFMPEKKLPSPKILGSIQNIRLDKDESYFVDLGKYGTEKGDNQPYLELTLKKPRRTTPRL